MYISSLLKLFQEQHSMYITHVVLLLNELETLAWWEFGLRFCDIYLL